jgi:hypothetical protein
MMKIIVAGDSLVWSYANDDYPASDGWVVKWVLLKSDELIEIVAGADGDDHKVEVAAAVSANYSPGEYTWTSFATKGNERYSLETGVTVIKADPATSVDGADQRSWTKRALDDIRAVIERRASDAVLQRDIDGVELRYYSLTELLQLETTLTNRYNAELGIEDLPLTLKYVTRGPF